MESIPLLFSLDVDCTRCAAWCCRVYAFDAGSAFADDKAAGERCRHLTTTDRCGVYGSRARHGYGACVGYTCHGAGPRLTRAAMCGRFPDESAAIRAYFPLRQLCESGALVERAMLALFGVSERRAPKGGAMRTKPPSRWETWLHWHGLLRELCLASEEWDGDAAATCLREIRQELGFLSSNTAFRRQLTRLPP